MEENWQRRGCRFTSSSSEKYSRVGSPLMMQKAEEIGRWLEKEFQTISSWFSRWKQRENITYAKSHGEVEETHTESADK